MSNEHHEPQRQPRIDESGPVRPNGWPVITPADAIAQPQPVHSWLRFARTTGRWLGMLALAWLGAVLAAMLLYTRFDPPYSTLTLAATLTGHEVRQSWVPLANIAPTLRHAVIVSEDAGFCRHSGISLGEIRQAIARSGEGTPRGASTISMQVTKNLFLWPQPSYLRKAIEIPLTLALEQIMSKPRILEIYLNIAEWGPGIYGAEAAAWHHFRKPAAALGAAESVLLAVTLPAPRTRNPARPSKHVQQVARIIDGRMRAGSPAISCIAGNRG